MGAVYSHLTSYDLGRPAQREQGRIVDEAERHSRTPLPVEIVPQLRVEILPLGVVRV